MSDAHGGGGGGGLPFLSTIEHFVHSSQGGASIHIAVKQLLILAGVMFIGFAVVAPAQTLNNLAMLAYLSPVWVPFILIRFTIIRYVQSTRLEFLASQEYVLLELHIPREVTKTPLAMETFFSNIHIGSGETTWYKKYIQGSTRPSWSCELVSIGGRVHFYIWTRVGFRRLVESYLYAQYPDLQIIEAEDYSRLFDPTDHHNAMFGCEFTKRKPDPFPLKVYTEYGLTPGAKPEENVDPLGQLIEIMGALGPEEQMWLQIIIRVSKDEKLGKKTPGGKLYTWRDEATDLIEKLRVDLSMKGQYIDPVTGKLHETKIGNLTKGQNDTINAIEHNITKQGFDVGIRAIYTAPEEKFQGIMVVSLLNMFKPFNNEANNVLGPSLWSASFNDYPWEDRSGHHKHHAEHEVTRLYRQRAYFTGPYKGPWSVMSTEELATLFHVPSSGITTPNLPRIQSSTSGAPSNLPS